MSLHWTKAANAQPPCNNFCTTWSQTVALATNVGYCCNNAFSQLPILGLQIHTSHLLSHQSEYFAIALSMSCSSPFAPSCPCFHWGTSTPTQIYHLIHFCTFLLPYCCEFPLRLGSSILPLAPDAPLAILPCPPTTGRIPFWLWPKNLSSTASMSTSAHQHICHDPLQSARTDSSFYHSGLASFCPPLPSSPNARRWTDQGGTQLPHGTSASKSTAMATRISWGSASKWSVLRPPPPGPPILTSFAMSNFSQAWQLAFVITTSTTITTTTTTTLHYTALR